MSTTEEQALALATRLRAIINQPARVTSADLTQAAGLLSTLAVQAQTAARTLPPTIGEQYGSPVVQITAGFDREMHFLQDGRTVIVHEEGDHEVIPRGAPGIQGTEQ